MIGCVEYKLVHFYRRPTAEAVAGSEAARCGVLLLAKCDGRYGS